MSGPLLNELPKMVGTIPIKSFTSVLGEISLGTGEAVIVEHTGKDAYWGDGGNGGGRNRLGQLLKQVREEHRLFKRD